MQGVAQAQPISELTLPEAIAVAIQLHQDGELDEAETLYRRVLDAAPEYPDALHFLGVLLHHRDRSDAAIELIERSIALDPARAGRYNNLGNVLVERGRLEDATTAYRRSVEIEPGNADAHNNLGALLKAQGRIDESAAAYQTALELDPEHAAAYTNMGNLLSSQGRHTEAVDFYSKAINLRPEDAGARHRLGFAYYALGQIEVAAEVFRIWLRSEPAHPIARHMLAACTGEEVPERAPDAYVQAVFDGFAASFDAKLEQLDYRAPSLVAEALARVADAPAKRLVVLDAGCGTGLCGPLLAPFAGRLVGVDLSARMLAAARLRGAYDELLQSELSEYMRAHPETYDLIVSADTLCYFGALDTVARVASRALRSGGLLIFTVESTEDAAAGYRINPHGRYSHTRPYVSRALAEVGLSEISIEAAILRSENHLPVNGLVVVARKSVGAERPAT
jgi:predicted TPR repeat methyltransferase